MKKRLRKCGKKISVENGYYLIAFLAGIMDCVANLSVIQTSQTDNLKPFLPIKRLIVSHYMI